MNVAVYRFSRRVWAMARKEVAHVRRDPGMLYLAIGMPLLSSMMSGAARSVCGALTSGRVMGAVSAAAT